MSSSDAGTKVGHLSPWETCKAFAFHIALQAIEKTLHRRSYDFLGEKVSIWIGKQLQVKGGGCPSEGAVVKAITRCQGKDWYPGKAETKSGGAAAGLHQGTEEEDRRGGHVAEAAHRSPHSRKGASEVAPNLSTPGLGTTRLRFQHLQHL